MYLGKSYRDVLPVFGHLGKQGTLGIRDLYGAVAASDALPTIRYWLPWL